MALDPNLIANGGGPVTGIAVSNGFIYLSNSNAGTISLYTDAGTPVATSWISGLSGPGALSVYNGDLYVLQGQGDVISEFDATTGAPIDLSLITGLNAPAGFYIEDVPEPATWFAGGLVAAACTARVARRRR